MSEDGQLWSALIFRILKLTWRWRSSEPLITDGLDDPTSIYLIGTRHRHNKVAAIGKQVCTMWASDTRWRWRLLPEFGGSALRVCRTFRERSIALWHKKADETWKAFQRCRLTACWRSIIPFACQLVHSPHFESSTILRSWRFSRTELVTQVDPRRFGPISGLHAPNSNFPGTLRAAYEISYTFFFCWIFNSADRKYHRVRHQVSNSIVR